MTTFRLRPENALTRLALLSTAYETLRDPVKRRAYDASLGLLGLNAAPSMQPKPVSPFIGTTVTSQVNRPRPAPAPQPAREPTRKAEPDPRIGSFIAASLRQPAPKEVKRQIPPPHAVEPVRPAPAPVYVEAEEQEEHARIHRNQAMIGAGIVGLAILGIATALPRPNADRLPTPTVQTQQAVTVGLPPATPAPDSAVGTPIEASAKTFVAHEQAPVEPAAQTVTDPTADAAAADQQSDQPATQQAAADPLAPIATEASAQPASDASTTDSAAESAPAPATTVAAAMPLANATIAQTIRRIGYACGTVASTEAVGGSKGVFKVTCSSGDSYQATPLHGRYHFRRLGSH